ncbi:MAG TPA: GNAT family N-acetyltransferase [Candidatus Udaeobacter sp.]|jgi:RimJ/RimL family protein N-acetyltransferase|nr:GNAT family N-acetyltransferase [Candidatus Udaeobacter sp.]
MENLTLVAHIPRQLLALIESRAAYEKSSGLSVADGVREFLLAASSDFLSALQEATAPDPWRFGFAIVHRIDNVVIGLCGFTGPPDSGGLVEIAYSISPDYQGRGFATEVAMALVDFASSSGRVRTVCAHTLPEVNASTRVLEKCGFRKTGEILDSENGLVWRWEKTPPTSTSHE